MSLDTARRVLEIEARALQEVKARLDASFAKAVDVLFACKGRVAVTGMGKSGLIGRKISATLSSTGTPSFFLHPAEALHGDLGMLARGDAMLAVSYGGETEEIIRLLEALKRLEMPLVTLTGKVASTLGEASEVALGGAGRKRARRGLLAESCPDGEHHGGDGGGRCAGCGVVGAPRISPR